MRLKIILISGAFAALACVGQLRSEDWLGEKGDLTRNSEGFAAVKEKVEAEKNKRMDDKAADLKRRIQQMEQKLESSNVPPSAEAAVSIRGHLESAKSLLSSSKPDAARMQEASKRVEDAAKIYKDRIAPAAKPQAPGDSCAQRERILKENIQPNDSCVDDSGAKKYH